MLRRFLEQQCGYSHHLIRENHPVGTGGTVPLVAFAQAPPDARSACVVIGGIDQGAPGEIEAYRGVGAPVVFRLAEGQLQVWLQGTARPTLHGVIPAADVASFFRRFHQELHPQRILRAKLFGSMETTCQLDFVDVGLMPMVEREIGQRLRQLIERLSADLQSGSAMDPEPLNRAILSLVAARIFHDKGVPTFQRLDLQDVDSVLSTVALHYGSRFVATRLRDPERRALSNAARTIAQHASFANVTTDALAEVYELAFTDPGERRTRGIMRTPSHVVDYILWKLEDWLEELPWEQRVFFEPACGDAAFLTSALRHLRSHQPDSIDLRDHLIGLDNDRFALEIARLCLTLTNIPNANGWHLEEADLFETDALERNCARSGIVLTHLTFGRFTPGERRAIAAHGLAPQLVNKSAEVLRRISESMRPGGLLGVIVPDTVLDTRDSRLLRDYWLTNFDIDEVTRFPLRVLNGHDLPSAVVIARKGGGTKGTVRFRKLEGKDSSLTEAVQERMVRQVDFLRKEDHVLRLGDLEEIWQWLAPAPRLGAIASIGQGLSYRGAERQRVVANPKHVVPGFVRLGRDPQIHAMPVEGGLNLDPKRLQSGRSGTVLGTSQVVMNHNAVGKGPWRILAFLDCAGHAVNSNFNVVRPTHPSASIEFLWALLNSPVANAYAWDHSDAKHVLAGRLGLLPVPRSWKEIVHPVTRLVHDYVRSAHAREDLESSKRLLLEVDAHLLAAYGLPARYERRLLDLFSGHRRPGVPFAQHEYFPGDFKPCVPLHEYLSPEFERATVGSLLARRPERVPEAVLQVLGRACEDFSDE